MPRRTRHRRRFHTDRVVANRRARYLREVDASSWGRAEMRAPDHEEWMGRLLSHGNLASTDPWDCGRHCVMCHHDKLLEPRRTRETRAWWHDWDLI